MDDGRIITIKLDPGAVEALEAAVAAGRHPSVEAAAEAAIDEWWADRVQDAIGHDRLRSMLQEAAASPTVDGRAAFTRLRAKYEAMARAKGT
jgi:hypothetical protein